MSTEQNNMADATTPRVMTCFIRYNENDDQSKIFDILKDFRTRHGLKFSHYKGYIFFTLSSEHMGELAKVRPFTVSKFKTSSEYSCTAEVAAKIKKQRDSFVRMRWNEEDEKIVFTSRTKAKTHNHLVRRIFKDAEQEFNNDSYTFNRSPRDTDEKDEKDEKDEPEKKEVKQEKPSMEGFVKVEKKYRKKDTEDKETKEVKETKEKPKSKAKYEAKTRVGIDMEPEAPKVRGKRANKNASA